MISKIARLFQNVISKIARLIRMIDLIAKLRAHLDRSPMQLNDQQDQRAKPRNDQQDRQTNPGCDQQDRQTNPNDRSDRQAPCPSGSIADATE
jgi:ABC-type uncharacterized transport system fused permease/ATPase subunit